jgi:hypothetical protein
MQRALFGPITSNLLNSQAIFDMYFAEGLISSNNGFYVTQDSQDLQQEIPTLAQQDLVSTSLIITVTIQQH